MNGVITSEESIRKCIAIYILTTSYGYTGVNIAKFVGLTPQTISQRKSQGREFCEEYPSKVLAIRKTLREQGIFPIKSLNLIEGVAL